MDVPRPPKPKTKTNLATSLADTLQARLDAAKVQASGPISFVDFLTSPDFCGPYFASRGIKPSPIILAIAAASEGASPDSITEEQARAVFRCGRIELGTGRRPNVVGIQAGRRGGKTSNLLATKAVHSAWTCPLPTLAPGEIARAVIIAPVVDQAVAAFNYCKGIVEGSPVLSRAVQPSGKDEILLRRPDGRLVEIVTRAFVSDLKQMDAAPAPLQLTS